MIDLTPWPGHGPLPAGDGPVLVPDVFAARQYDAPADSPLEQGLRDDVAKHDAEQIARTFARIAADPGREYVLATGHVRRAEYRFVAPPWVRCSACAAVYAADGRWRTDSMHWQHACEGRHPQVGHCKAEPLSNLTLCAPSSQLDALLRTLRPPAAKYGVVAGSAENALWAVRAVEFGAAYCGDLSRIVMTGGWLRCEECRGRGLDPDGYGDDVTGFCIDCCHRYADGTIVTGTGLSPEARQLVEACEAAGVVVMCVR